MSQQEQRGEFPLCYGCGRDNPIGFRLHVHGDGERTWAEFTPRELHCGWPDIVHGGVLCVLLDEVVSYLPYFRLPGVRTMTGKMETRFRRPAREGQRLFISAWMVKARSRVLEVKSSITLLCGTTVAESECLIFVLGKEI